MAVRELVPFEPVDPMKARSSNFKGQNKPKLSLIHI